MIDLHIHTTSSDGSEEPEEILRKAEVLGLKYISITDHDSIEAYVKLGKMNSNSNFSGKIIPGCEFSAVCMGKPIEILGYGLDLRTIEETGIVSNERFLERENRNLKKLMEVCKSLGIKCTPTISIKNGKYFASQVLHGDIKKYPENEKLFSREVWESINAFYRTCVTSKDSPFFIDQANNLPTVHEITSLIKKAGGRAFLAHIYGYCMENPEEYLESLVENKELDGIECYHSLHSMEKTKILLDYCARNSLYSSGGSDYHGKIKPNVKLGESIPGVKIPYGIAQSWLSKYEEKLFVIGN